MEIEAEEFEDISMKYGIESVPSFVFIKVIRINILSRNYSILNLIE
jgi:hypothetical protein